VFSQLKCQGHNALAIAFFFEELMDNRRQPLDSEHGQNVRKQLYKSLFTQLAGEKVKKHLKNKCSTSFFTLVLCI